MSKSLAELKLQQGRLVERIAHQRAGLVRDTVPIQIALNRADRGLQALRDAVQYFREHPLALLLGVATVVVIKPRRVWRLVGQGWMIWRSVQTLAPWLPRSLVRSTWAAARSRWQNG